LKHLILFTRYPHPGTTKTRLIPRLGAEGAARLQRQMTEYIIHQARHLLQKQAITLTVYFTDSSLSQMQDWLGSDLQYAPQQGEDLGQRLHHACADCFHQGAASVIVIGSDCPSLTTTALAYAFQQLNDHDAVIGPARDGGYYLLGLQRFYPALFQGIPWSSPQVFSQTLAIAQTLHLNLAILPPLPDIDRPEDLQYIPPQILVE
jgi:rSAM/selenodomain-associated transferase 1